MDRWASGHWFSNVSWSPLLPCAGTLHPNCQDSSGRPRRDIGTILQILNDLLSATRHYQGMPHSLMQLRCQTQCSLSSSPPLSPDLVTHATSEKLAPAAHQPFHSGLPCPTQAGTCKPSGELPFGWLLWPGFCSSLLPASVQLVPPLAFKQQQRQGA